MILASERIILSRFVKTLAAIGIFYQIFSQTYDYFCYPTYSTVERSHVNTRLPAISLCAAFWQGSKEKYYASLPVHQASLLMPSYNEVINFCDLTLPNGSIVDCESISKPHKYMNNKMLCFSLFEQERTFLPDDQLMYSQEVRLKNLITSPLLRVKFKTPWNDSNHYTMTIRSPKKPIRLLRSTESKVWMEPRVNEQVNLNYKITRRTELLPPYGSCRNYPKPFDSEQMMLNCWFDKYTDTNGTHYWPHWIFFDFEKNYTQEEKSRSWPSQSVNNEQFPAVNEECSKKTSCIDCDRNYIVLFKTATFQSSSPGKYLITEIPWVPATQLTITNFPKKDLLEYFNEVGGILSMWIGFSVYVSCTHLTSFTFRCLISFTQRSSAPLNPLRRNKRHNHLPATFVSSQLETQVRPRTRLREINDLVIKLLCWMATLYFVVEIIMIYFEKPFDTSIIAKTPTRLEMLKVSVCFDMNINPEKVKRLYPHLYESVPRERWVDVFTIDQLFRTTTEWSEVYDPSSTYLSPDNVYTRIDQHFNFTKSITGRLTCFTTFGQREYKLRGPIKKHFRAAISYATNMVLSLNTSQLHKLNQSRISVHFHDDGSVMEDIASPDLFTIIANKDPRLYPDNFIVRVYRTMRKLYPDHMMSTCWNYEKKFGVDRGSLFDRCISKNFISKYRVWPSGYQVRQSTQRDQEFKIKGIHIGDLNISNYSMQEKFKLIRDECNRILHPPECETLYVKVQVEDEYYHNPGLTTIVLYPPGKQFLVYEQQATYTVIDLFGYIGGTINAWIGLSFLDVDSLFLALYSLFKCQRFRAKINTHASSSVF